LLKYKIVLAGQKFVGKSSLVARFCDNVFNPQMKETIGVAFKKKLVPVKDHIVELNIWDFGGEDKYRTLFPSYVTGASGALIVFDLTRKATLDDIDNWIQIIDENTKNIVKLIIGAKGDLINEREVQEEDIQKVCDQYKFCSNPVETSSKTGDNVEKAFITLCENILEEKFHFCKKCGKGFPKTLRFCQYCGAKIEEPPVNFLSP